MFRSIRNPITTATLAVILTLGLGLSVTAAAAASDRHEQQSPNPTIVFVHGGWADSSGWNQEITNLERRGYTVIAPANPLRDLTSDSGEPAWKTIPSWYMVATQDHALPPATERFMAQRAHASIVEVDSSHVAMISQPEATTRLILDAADSIR